MSTLKFKSQNNSLLITGNVFYIKQDLISLGGTWNPLFRAWRLPADIDTKELRDDLSRKLEIVLEEEKQRNDNIKRKTTTSEYSWISCNKCEAVTRAKQAGVCNNCVRTIQL